VSSRLADLTWTSVERRRNAVLVVPVGSTEQHGPHLPLSTDSDVAVALAERLAAACPQVVLAPVLPYGASGEHAEFAGTLSIGREALELVVVELVRSATLTWRRVLLVSGHGGNAVPLSRAVHRLRGEGRDVLVWSPPWRGDAHAGHTETSVQLALDPERVRVDAAAPGATADLRALLPLLQRSGVRAVSANGVLGDPRAATARHGADLLRSATDALVDLVGGWS
jgi:mycofactocin system creatininase family protein